MRDSSKSRIKITVCSVLLVAALVALDQWTKHLAAVSLKGTGPHVLIDGVLEFLYLENAGAAFSMLQNKQIFFYILTTVFIIAAIWVLHKLPIEKKYRPIRICVLVLTAGAIGNLIDRIVHRYVVDFIYFSIIDFPVFNVADIYVTLSVIALVVLVLFHYKDSDFAFLSRKKEETEEEGTDR